MVTFTTGKGFQLAAAVCGAVGTFLLYKGSFAFESPAYWGSPQLTANMDARNKRRRLLQRTGLLLLMLSFVLGGASIFLE